MAPPAIDPVAMAAGLPDRYAALWDEVTREEVIPVDEQRFRVADRLARLNALGFDVDEVELVTDGDGARLRVHTRVAEPGQHRRELFRLTGLEVGENQARRLLNDLAAFTAHHDLGSESRSIVAHRWLTTVYEPITAMVPADLRGRLEPAEVFHEILEHRWFLSERAGGPVDTRVATLSYLDNVLKARPEEALTGDPDTAELPVVREEEELEPFAQLWPSLVAVTGGSIDARGTPAAGRGPSVALDCPAPG